MSMRTTKDYLKINYKERCQALFDMESPYTPNFRMLVYTGRKEEERPVFRVVRAVGECKLLTPAGKTLWGVVGLDEATGECQWYDYKRCVSLEDWAVLDRLLRREFGWMELTDPGLLRETRILAKAQLREGGV